MSNLARRVAVLGAGPVGIEAALEGSARGYRVAVYERHRVGAHLRRWGFVRMFTPWRMNVSERGLALLPEALDLDACPTGDELLERYLEPLAATLPDAVRVRTSVRAVGREGMDKRAPMGAARRRRPFRLLLEDGSGQRIEHAEVVLDCTGTYGTPGDAGDGGIPAPGASAAEAAGLVHHDLAPLRDVEAFRSLRVLVLGDGLSAATAVVRLAPVAELVWAVRHERPLPVEPAPGDPLAGRAEIVERARALVETGAVPYLPGRTLERLDPDAAGTGAVLAGRDGEQTVVCDRVLALVGYRPDRSLYRQLQVHECYASFGPMKLAASLLADAGADCLSQSSSGAETLTSPEPDFFILGAKSYGSASNFLLRAGLEQVRDVYDHLDRTGGNP